MKNHLKQWLLVLVATAMLVLTGCEEKKGPMETAGEKIDTAAEKTGQAMEEAAEKTGEAVDDAVNK